MTISRQGLMLAPPLGPLAPCSGMLLPAPSRLAGPVASPDAASRLGATPWGTDQAGPALAGMASQAGRALDQAKKLAGRAGAAAAAHRPELERRAQQAAADGAARMDRLAKSAALRASRNAQAARDSLAAAPPPAAILQRHRGAILYGLGALCIVLLAGGAVFYNVLTDRATRDAAARVNTAAATFNLFPLLHYDSISASPFGATTLTHVTAGPFDGIVISAKTLRISNVVWHGAALAGFHAALDGISLPLLQIARRTTPTETLRTAIGLGYTAPQAQLSLDATFDDASTTLTIASTGNVQGLGDATLTATLGGLTSRAALVPLRAALSALAQGGAQQLSGWNPEAAGTDEGAMPAATLAQASLIVNDAPLAARLHQITGQDVPGTNPHAGAVPPGIAAALNDSMPPDRAHAAAHLIAAWLNEGGRLTVSMHPGSPVSLLGPNLLPRSGLAIAN